MSAKKKDEGEQEPAKDLKSLEGFVSDYLNGYREYISSKDMDEIHTPQFFKAYPFAVEIFELPNSGVCALFKKASRSKFVAQEGDFEDIMSRLRDPDFDFMQMFPPFTLFNADEAKRLARMDADRDLKSSRRLEMLTAAESHISDIHKDIQTVVDLNPWLDQQTAEQKLKLDRARELILELYREVDISREERFSDYMRQFSEVMAFDRGEVEEVTGEMALEMETALEDMEARLSAIEKSESSKGDPAALKKLESALNELSKGLTEANYKIKCIEKESGNVDLESELEPLNSKMAALEKKFKAVSDDVALSKDIKDTVFRDSKRTYNLNERVTDIERNLASLKKDSGKDSLAAVKALEGRINVMEKHLKDFVKSTVKSEIARSKPVVIESPVVETIEPLPGGGGTVKKTVKKTTTKKTTRSK